MGLRVRLSDKTDFIARKVLMSALLYYGLDKPLVSDAQFDKWCRRLARDWDRLSRYRQWQLGSPDELKTSGYHVKVTRAVAGGAHAWLQANGFADPFMVAYTKEPKRSKRYDVEWWSPDSFIYHKLETTNDRVKRTNKKATGRSDNSGLNKAMQQGKATKRRIRLETESNVEGKTKPKRSKRTRSLNKFFK